MGHRVRLGVRGDRVGGLRLRLGVLGRGRQGLRVGLGVPGRGRQIIAAETRRTVDAVERAQRAWLGLG